jgi:hypothetical protein
MVVSPQVEHKGEHQTDALKCAHNGCILSTSILALNQKGIEVIVGCEQAHAYYYQHGGANVL